MTILICGASGRTSGYVISNLIKSGHDNLRLMVHHETSVASLKERFPSESITYCQADFLDYPSLLRAMNGIDVVFYNGPAFHQQETAMGIAAIDAAKESGVSHFVYCSVLHPLRSKMLNHKVKLAVEEYLIESRLNYTILQPTHLMQNLPLASILSPPKPIIAVGYSPDTFQGFLSLTDLGEVASSILQNPGPHNMARYELVAENRTYESVIKLLRDLSGKDIDFVTLSPEQAVLRAKTSGMIKSEYGEDALGRMLFYYNRWGLTGNPNILTWLLGRKPTDYETYAKGEISKIQKVGEA